MKPMPASSGPASSSGRTPMRTRSTRATIMLITMIMSGNGTHATPALTALKPRTVCVKRVRKKNTANIAVPINNIMM